MSNTTPSPTVVHLWGAKGGVGTSTVAALIAVHASRRRAVELKATTAEGVEELAAILGVSHRPDEALRLSSADGDDHPLVVIDGGTEATPPPGTTASFLVLRPCYLGLRRAVAASHRSAGVILLTEPERALQRGDVEGVLGITVTATLAVTPTVARTVDAGLLAARPPRFPLDDLLAVVTT